MGLRHYLLISLVLLQIACSAAPVRQRGYGFEGPDHHKVVTTARQQLGKNYHFGGDNPDDGFDCSGLVYYSFLQAGVSLPRTTLGQLRRTRPVARKDLQLGDLLFFRISRSRISHVAIYLGNSRFIHAPSTGKSVSIASLNSPYWQKRYIRAGRI